MNLDIMVEAGLEALQDAWRMRGGIEPRLMIFTPKRAGYIPLTTCDQQEIQRILVTLQQLPDTPIILLYLDGGQLQDTTGIVAFATTPGGSLGRWQEVRNNQFGPIRDYPPVSSWLTEIWTYLQPLATQMVC